MMRPETIQLEDFGDFHLWQAFLGEHEFFYYSREIETPEGRSIKIVLHPPKNHFSWADFTTAAPGLIKRVQENYQKIFLSRWFPIWNLFRAYGNWSITPAKQRKLSGELRLQMIKINLDEDHEIVFNGLSSHESLDLFISFNDDFQMTRAWFDG